MEVVYCAADVAVLYTLASLCLPGAVTGGRGRPARQARSGHWAPPRRHSWSPRGPKHRTPPERHGVGVLHDGCRGGLHSLRRRCARDQPAGVAQQARRRPRRRKRGGASRSGGGPPRWCWRPSRRAGGRASSRPTLEVRPARRRRRRGRWRSLDPAPISFAAKTARSRAHHLILRRRHLDLAPLKYQLLPHRRFLHRSPYARR
jgi:hypothetical protein